MRQSRQIGSIGGSADPARQARAWQWLPYAVGIGLAVLTLFAWNFLSQSEKRQLDAALELHLRAAKEAISNGLEARVEPLRRMASRWEEFGGPSRERWDFDAALVYQAPSFQAVEWVDANDHVRWVTPEEGNEKLIGLDLSFEERRRRALEKARRERMPVITEPIELVTGGRGFRAIFPLFRENEFEGYISGVFRTQELMTGLTAESVVGSLLAVYDEEMEIFRRPGPVGGEEERWAREGAVRVYEAQWRVRLWPTPAMLDSYLTPVPHLLLGSGLLLSFLLALTTRLALAARRQAHELERSNVSMKREIEHRIRAEESLRANEERYRLISELTSDFSYAYTLNPDGSVIRGWITEAYTRITGLTPEESDRVGWASIFHPDDRHFVPERNRQLLAGKPDTREFRIFTTSGEVRWLRDSARPFHLDPADGSVFVVGAAKDITADKEAETALRLSARQQAAVAELGRSALETTELEPLFRIAMVTVAQTIGVEFCKVLQLQPGGQALRLVAGVGWKEESVGNVLVGAGLSSQAGFTLQSNQPIVVEDLRTEKRFQGPALLVEHGVVSGMSCIIPKREGPFGVLGAHAKERRRFTTDDVNFLQAVAHVLGAAVQRHETEEALRQLSGRLLQLQDEERRKLARELHDSTIQELAGISLLLASVEERISRQDSTARQIVSEAITLAEESARGLRTVSYLLHPPLLDEAGLASALRDYAEGFARRSGLTIEIDIPDSFERLPPECEITLFRVAQESLTNVYRHSGSPRARVRVTQESDRAVLQVIDEGHGGAQAPDPAGSSAAVTLGVGLRGMRERLRQLGGKLEIESSRKGTIVTAILRAQSMDAP